MQKQAPKSVNRSYFSQPQKRLIFAFVAIAFILRLYHLDTQSLWFDESLSAFFARQPLEKAILSMLQEGLHHSPLYYILLRPFALGAFNEFSLRFLSVCLGTLAIPLIAHLGRVTVNSQVGVWAALLLAINPFHAWYSQETRMYALVITTTIGAMYFFYKVLNQPRPSNWLAMIVCTAIGINSHHFAFFIPLVQFVFILITFKQTYKIFRRWVAAEMVVGLSFIPWVLVVLDWGKFYLSSATQETPTAYDLFQTFWNFSIGYTERITPIVVISLTVFFILLIWGCRFLLQARRNNLLIAVWLLIPITVTFFISFRFHTYMDRYISLTLPAFVLLIAAGIGSIRSTRWQNSFILAVVIFSLAGLLQVYYNPSVYYRADWRSVGQFLQQETSAEDIIAPWYYQDLLPLNFYYYGHSAFAPVVTFDQVALPPLPDTPGTQKIWVIIAHPNNSAHTVGHCQDFDTQKISSPPITKNWLIQNQNRLRLVKSFPCIRVELYQ